MNTPWPKFSTSIRPNTSVRPEAVTKTIMPIARPATVSVTQVLPLPMAGSAASASAPSTASGFQSNAAFGMAAGAGAGPDAGALAARSAEAVAERLDAELGAPA